MQNDSFPENDKREIETCKDNENTKDKVNQAAFFSNSQNSIQVNQEIEENEMILVKESQNKSKNSEIIELNQNEVKFDLNYNKLTNENLRHNLPVEYKTMEFSEFDKTEIPSKKKEKKQKKQKKTIKETEDKRVKNSKLIDKKQDSCYSIDSSDHNDLNRNFQAYQNIEDKNINQKFKSNLISREVFDGEKNLNAVDYYDNIIRNDLITRHSGMSGDKRIKRNNSSKFVPDELRKNFASQESDFIKQDRTELEFTELKKKGKKIKKHKNKKIKDEQNHIKKKFENESSNKQIQFQTGQNFYKKDKQNIKNENLEQFKNFNNFYQTSDREGCNQSENNHNNNKGEIIKRKINKSSSKEDIYEKYFEKMEKKKNLTMDKNEDEEKKIYTEDETYKNSHINDNENYYEYKINQEIQDGIPNVFNSINQEKIYNKIQNPNTDSLLKRNINYSSLEEKANAIYPINKSQNIKNFDNKSFNVYDLKKEQDISNEVNIYEENYNNPNKYEHNYLESNFIEKMSEDTNIEKKNEEYECGENLVNSNNNISLNTEFGNHDKENHGYQKENFYEKKIEENNISVKQYLENQNPEKEDNDDELYNNEEFEK